MGLIFLRHVGPSQTRGQSHVPCIGGWILFRCTTRKEVLFLIIVKLVAQILQPALPFADLLKLPVPKMIKGIETKTHHQ